MYRLNSVVKKYVFIRRVCKILGKVSERGSSEVIEISILTNQRTVTLPKLRYSLTMKHVLKCIKKMR